MLYTSTRGLCQNCSFEQAIFSGWVSDGGIFLPNYIPVINRTDLQKWSTHSYKDIVKEIVALYVSEDEIPRNIQADLLDAAFTRISLPEVVKNVKLKDGLNVLELFHGPTLAFKDLSMLCLGNFINYFLDKNDKRLIVLVGTSGDTGSSAIEAVRHSDRVDIIVLLPEGHCSEVQERMMTTVVDDSVHVFVVEGTSDDLDEPIKAIFNKVDIVSKYNIIGFNSINWGRIMVQIAHHFYGYFQVCEEVGREVEIVVPTGAAGNLTAGIIAQSMGLPVKFVAAVTVNDIVHRTVIQGDFSTRKDVRCTLAPSMDIQVPYNMERIWALLNGRNYTEVTKCMDEFEKSSSTNVAHTTLKNLQNSISTFVASDEDVKATMLRCWNDNKYVLCPHSAVGVTYHYSKQTKPDHPRVCIATASPAKFSEAVTAAGLTLQSSNYITDLLQKPTKFREMRKGQNWEQILFDTILDIGKKWKLA